ncbi:uncharacterized protein PV09_08112 [Verruconis gallopava]|uniref:Uncharacterized protein n=1 Tax=Verruconis gallopava TaxID=253628 RepID=A0A0D2AMQ5_9PEZI|nr:uncharacterized protein PV09_08112 [Verruconis gallopava]KIW00404.1 hypothetical protein PV09_08112 [Verruconis gallopava]
MAGNISISRLLVANRGEIAIRVLTAARELGMHTIAIYTAEDSNHAVYADEGILLDQPSDFTNVERLLGIAKKANAEAVHPGYGFLSESPRFADELANAGILFVGPSTRVLQQTADKTDARALADANKVPTLPASVKPMRNFEDVQSFVANFGLPIMFKAVDGGGGRGIRFVQHQSELEDSFNRARGESPSGQVFIERAAVDGFRHVEVQILADNYGNVGHLWERECSIQRRFQKIVELAPSTIKDRELVSRVIRSSVGMAKAIGYSSLGTFEFLVHESKPEYYFLEINPRLQVEHTVTEEISGVDIVRSQLLLAQGATIESLNLPSRYTVSFPPPAAAIQLRVTAEDAQKDFTLSMGRVTQFQPPIGAGVRVDTHLATTKPTTVGSNFDSLLAKIIVRGSNLQAAIEKGLRALRDTTIKGVKTNIDVLLGILSHSDFRESQCNIKWLESQLSEIIVSGQELEGNKTLSLREPYITSTTSYSSQTGAAGLGNAPLLFRKGDTFKLQLKDITMKQSSQAGKSATAEEYLLRIDRVLTNNFPIQLMADATFQSFSSSKTYGMNLTSTTQTNVASSKHRHADPTNEAHIRLPFPGQFVEMYVDVGDKVAAGELLCVVRQMKMELEVRAPRQGTIKWVCDVEEGEQVNEGLLLCELAVDEPSNTSSKSLAKL